ncbi:Fe-S oxidoreductase [Sphingobium sp. Ant17]|uniref:Fe-S oxidoreductase n=1 Tax=Sphingobium sp. Ant17 TaxID=1461752 RepID=UPI0009DF981F|nr:Fe-S oxidoreductase [Sphingobium sp. Ant17]
MKSIMLAGAALMGIASISSAAIAQQMPASQAPGDAMTPPTDPSMGPPPPPANDPNAGMPTGAVPSDPGMMPATPGAPNDPTAPMGSSSNPVTVGGNMTPPPAEAKDYPVCSKTVQDSCVNPSEARKMRKR